MNTTFDFVFVIFFSRSPFSLTKFIGRAVPFILPCLIYLIVYFSVDRSPSVFPISKIYVSFVLSHSLFLQSNKGFVFYSLSITGSPIFLYYPYLCLLCFTQFSITLLQLWIFLIGLDLITVSNANFSLNRIFKNNY